MRISCFPNIFSCFGTCSSKAPVEAEKPNFKVDEQKALNALAIMKLEQVKGAHAGEAKGVKFSSFIEGHMERMKTATEEEAAELSKDFDKLFSMIGEALSELHVHEAGAINVYEATKTESLDYVQNQAVKIQKLLSDPKLSSFNNDAISPEALMDIANMYVDLNYQEEIHGSVTIGTLNPEHIFIEGNANDKIVLTFENPGSLVNSLDSKGEGIDLAFNDVIKFVHSTIEYIVRQGLSFKDSENALREFIRGYHQSFKERLQERAKQKGLETDDLRALLECYTPTMLYPLISLKVMLEVLERNLTALKGMEKSDPLYERTAKIVKNTINTIDCETTLFKRFIAEELKKYGISFDDLRSEGDESDELNLAEVATTA